MSLQLAIAWIERELRFAAARTGARRLLQQAAAAGAEASLIAAPELTTSGKCLLARWTGYELVVVELTEAQQRGLGLEASQLIQCEDRPGLPPDLPPQQQTSLDRVRLIRATHSCRQPMEGICSVKLDQGTGLPIEKCALRVKYFSPEMPSAITHYWHLNYPLMSSGDLRFSLPPFAQNELTPLVRTIVLFCQLVTAADWTRPAGCQPISNTLAVVTEFVPGEVEWPGS